VADASVRPAREGDVARIAGIQSVTWRHAYRDLLPAAALDSVAATAEPAWRRAVLAPPSTSHHVLVALERHGRQEWLVGFVAFGPADDPAPDGSAPNRPAPDDPAGERAVELGPLLVEPRWGRRGHGSRLLAAALSQARAEGMIQAVTWAPSTDSVTLGFFRAAGWTADGCARVLDTGAGEIRELRLRASVEPHSSKARRQVDGDDL